MQVSSLTSAFSTTLIASTGHTDSQAAQPVHVALSTFTAIIVYLVAPLKRVFLFIFYRLYPKKYSFRKYRVYVFWESHTFQSHSLPSIFLFWFILLHLFIRSLIIQSKIKINKTKFKCKDDEKIKEGEAYFFNLEPVWKSDRSKERNEHTNQYQQKHLDEISFLPHVWESITTFLLKGISAFTNYFLEVLSSTITFRAMTIPQSSQQLSFVHPEQVHSQYRWVHR